MQAETDRIRDLVARCDRGWTTQPYADSVRSEVVEFATAARARGWSWQRTGEAVGLCETTVHRWVEALSTDQPRRPTTAMVPVDLVTQPPPEPTTTQLVLVSPGGFRLEGLRLTEAAQLLAALA